MLSGVHFFLCSSQCSSSDPWAGRSSRYNRLASDPWAGRSGRYDRLASELQFLAEASSYVLREVVSVAVMRCVK